MENLKNFIRHGRNYQNYRHSAAVENARDTPRNTQATSRLSSLTTSTMAPRATPTANTNPFDTIWKAYNGNTPNRLKFIDSFLLFLMLSGIVQFAYCILVSNFPYNAFLSGFGSTVGQFVLTASLRSQVNPENKDEFKEISPERAFADFALGSIVLHFFVYNFLG